MEYTIRNGDLLRIEITSYDMPGAPQQKRSGKPAKTASTVEHARVAQVQHARKRGCKHAVKKFDGTLAVEACDCSDLGTRVIHGATDAISIRHLRHRT